MQAPFAIHFELEHQLLVPFPCESLKRVPSTKVDSTQSDEHVSPDTSTLLCLQVEFLPPVHTDFSAFATQTGNQQPFLYLYGSLTLKSYLRRDRRLHASLDPTVQIFSGFHEPGVHDSRPQNHLSLQSPNSRNANSHEIQRLSLNWIQQPLSLLRLWVIEKALTLTPSLLCKIRWLSSLRHFSTKCSHRSIPHLIIPFVIRELE
jgi:hypothetical protein